MEEYPNQQKPPARNASHSDAGGSVSTPPASEVTIRTMESDIKAIEQGGGEAGPAKIFSVPETKPEESKVESKFNIPGYTGPEKPIFAPAAIVSPESFLIKKSAGDETGPQSRSAWRRILGIVFGILIICIVLGLLGYFVIFPWIFTKQMPAVQ